jgi:hypothetical protein
LANIYVCLPTTEPMSFRLANEYALVPEYVVFALANITLILGHTELSINLRVDMAFLFNNLNVNIKIESLKLIKKQLT